MAPSEMVQASEVQIYERTLYKVVGCTLWTIARAQTSASSGGFCFQYRQQRSLDMGVL